jgi:hypothetical protein
MRKDTGVFIAIKIKFDFKISFLVIKITSYSFKIFTAIKIFGNYVIIFITVKRGLR